MMTSILKTSEKYKSDIQGKFKQQLNPKHCSFNDENTKIIAVDNWKAYNYANSANEPDDCSCNCSLV